MVPGSFSNVHLELNAAVVGIVLFVGIKKSDFTARKEIKW